MDPTTYKFELDKFHCIWIALNVQVCVAVGKDVRVETRCKGRYFDLREREKETAG